MDGTYTVSDLARASGVTVRTLHHYDQIGLLTPTSRTVAGYRSYSRADAERLGHILAYRACGLSLAEIAVLLESPGEDRAAHLRRQLDLVEARGVELERQRQALTRAWEAAAMGINLDPDEILEVFGEHDPTAHAEEARERWGSTDPYRESQRRTSQYSKQEWQRIRSEADAVEEELAECKRSGLPADGERARAAAEGHRQHIDRWYYPCSHEMQVGLADMYVADQRFAEHYEAREPGLAEYVREAIYANALSQ